MGSMWLIEVSANIHQHLLLLQVFKELEAHPPSHSLLQRSRHAALACVVQELSNEGEEEELNRV